MHARLCAFASMVALVGLASTACKSSSPPPPNTLAPSGSPVTGAAGATTTTTTAGSSDGPAAIGKPAPDFTLQDVDGKTVHLADYRGKVVVLEWFNPECPFVRASHTKGSLNGLSKRYTDRPDAKITWIAIDSSAVGKQGNLPDRIREGKAKYAMQEPILRDQTGEVGHKYGATNTPHMFVIDTQGNLAYTGAIDNSPDGEGESPAGGKLVNYVADAIDSVLAGRPVAVTQTKAYGCGVKY